MQNYQVSEFSQLQLQHNVHIPIFLEFLYGYLNKAKFFKQISWYCWFRSKRLFRSGDTWIRKFRVWENNSTPCQICRWRNEKTLPHFGCQFFQSRNFQIAFSRFPTKTTPILIFFKQKIFTKFWSRFCSCWNFSAFLWAFSAFSRKLLSWKN